MYDNYKISKSYGELKDTVVDILNNDMDYNREIFLALCNDVQKQYDTGDLTSAQYDELMGYLQDLGEPYADDYADYGPVDGDGDPQGW